MQHPDEGTIHGWLDHALARDDALRVEAHVAECAQCAAVVAEARGLIAAASRLLASLDAADEPRATPRIGADGTAGEARIGADGRGWNGGRQPRIRAEGRGSVGVGGEPQGAGVGEVGEWGGTVRRAGWGAWITRVAAVLVVMAVGAMAVREVAGPGAPKRVATPPRVVAPTHVTTPKLATTPEHTTTSERAETPERATTRVAAAKRAPAHAFALPPAGVRADSAAAEDAAGKASSTAAPAGSAANESSVASTDPSTNKTSVASAAAPPAMPRFRAPVRDAREMVRTRDAARSASARRGDGVLAEQRENIIRGRVMSTVGQPVAHALVALRGTHFATMTNEDGRYRLTVPARLARDTSAVVTVRLIGYQPSSKAVALATDGAEHDFALAPSNVALSEVVVTGMDSFTGRTAMADSVSAASLLERRRSDSVSAAPPAARPRADSVAPRRDGATLTLVSSRTTHDPDGRAVHRSVYQVRPGVQVTVDAVRASDDQPPPRDGSTSRGQQDARALAPDTIAVPAAPGAGINSIQWTAEDGTRFTLSGPLSLAELRTLKPLVH